MRVEGFWSFGLAAAMGLGSALGSGLSSTTASVPVAQAALTTSSTSSSSLPAGVQVFVGYADSLRANASNFPTPWNGSPMTEFRGCTTNCIWDAGALRIVNNSSSSITVNGVTVHIDTCTFSGWSGASLAPGWDLIITQQETGGSDGCNGSAFDTSDVGPGGSSYAGNCTPDGIRPVVDLTIDGSTSSLTDSGQVLNTGGFDPGLCGLGSNESTQWTVIGSQPCKGSELTLSPVAQTRPVLTTATVIATFMNSCGQPLSNTAVNFAALSGPNSGITGSGVTNANGQTSFSYSSSKLGTDSLKATINNLIGSISSNDATVTWTVSFAPGGGSFVIGDKGMSAGSGLARGEVLFWGAQWWKVDLLSGGTAPAAFKGFEKSILSPSCGAQIWTVTPGNSPHPPSTVPPLMAVIVADHITQKGSTISGDIVHIVLVQTDADYGPAPGHTGTGTIVATLC